MCVTFYSALLLEIVYRDTKCPACSGEVTMNVCKYKLTVKSRPEILLPTESYLLIKAQMHSGTIREFDSKILPVLL